MLSETYYAQNFAGIIGLHGPILKVGLVYKCILATKTLSFHGH